MCQVAGGSGSSGKVPTTAANNASVGTVAWTNPGNIYTSDNVYATAALGNNIVSNYLVASGFNFAIPAGSTINGIAVSVERKEGTLHLYGHQRQQCEARQGRDNNRY